MLKDGIFKNTPFGFSGSTVSPPLSASENPTLTPKNGYLDLCSGSVGGRN